MSQRNSFVASLGILAAVGFGGLALAQDRPGEPTAKQDTYTMTTRLLVADTCNHVCPGLFPQQCADGAKGVENKGVEKRMNGQTAEKQAQQDLAVAIVEDGKMGDVSLKGARWAMLGEFDPATCKLMKHTLFIDTNAKPEQKTALRKIFAAPPFTGFGAATAVTEVPIDVTGGKEALEAWNINFGDKGTIVITPLAGGNGRGPTVIENPLYPFPAYKVIVAKAEGDFRADGQDLKLAGKTGQISHFVLKGDIPAGTLPAGMKKDANDRGRDFRPTPK